MPKAPGYITNILNLLRNVAYSQPATVYLGLFSTSPTNDVQTLTTTGNPTGGTFTLTFGGQTTSALNWNCTAAQVQTALQALSSILAGSALVTGSNGEPDAMFPHDSLVVTFVGAKGLASQSAMTHADSLTGGASPVVVVTHTTTGAAGTELSGNNYGRVAVTFSAPTGIQMTNSGVVSTPSSTGSQGNAVAWGLFDAASSGNLLYYDALTGTNDVQTVTITGTPTGGTFTLTFGGQTTQPIAYNATDLQVEELLSALSTIGEGNVQVRGGTYPGDAMVVTFIGTLRYASQSAMTHTDSFTGGASPAAAVVHTTTGASGAININAANQSAQFAAGALVISET